ncbi:hypothetical protein IW150_004735, partial [Coemansia sp. RSA 2607]
QFGKPKQQEGTRWANVESFSKLPADAIRGGTYKNEPFYIGRAPYKDSVQVGMVTKSKDGLVITYDGKTLRFHKYEVLCGPPSSVEWEPMHGKFDPKLIRGKKKPIKCGKEKKGEILYAATTSQNGRDYGGKVGANSKYMLYPSSGKEEKAKDYFVLCQVDV